MSDKVSKPRKKTQSFLFFINLNDRHYALIPLITHFTVDQYLWYSHQSCTLKKSISLLPQNDLVINWTALGCGTITRMLTLSRRGVSFRGSRIAPLMCNPVLNGVVNFTLWPLYLQGKNIWNPPNRRLSWPHSMPRRLGE